MNSATFFALLIAYSSAVDTQVEAQDSSLNETAESPELWQGNSLGISPEEFAQNIQALNEIISAEPQYSRKSKKLKSMKIKYTDDGVDVFGVKLKLEPKFDDDRLSSVTLFSDSMCASSSDALFNKFVPILVKKYPIVLSGKTEFDDYQAKKALLLAYQADGTAATRTVFQNDNTTVLLTFTYEKARRPSYPYGAGKFARSLFNIALASYDSQLASCNGSGDETMRLSLSYLANQDVEAMVQAAEDENDQANEIAEEKL